MEIELPPSGREQGVKPDVETGEFRPHRVDWTVEKVTRFWDFYALTRKGDFFSEKHSRHLADLLMRHRPRSVVDIGCGTGPFIAEVATRGVNAVGVDSSSGVLDAARARSAGIIPSPAFHLGSIVSLPLPDMGIEAATLFEVVEHLDDETLTQTLSEARRVLAIGGILMISTPNREDLAASTLECPDCGAQFHSMQHVRSWTARSLADALRIAGFRDVRVRAVRLVENGSAVERALRRAYYALRRQRPRLVAFAVRGD